MKTFLPRRLGGGLGGTRRGGPDVNDRSSGREVPVKERSDNDRDGGDRERERERDRDRDGTLPTPSLNLAHHALASLLL